MKHHRGHWSRGAWPRKTSLVEAAHSSPPMRNVVKEESGTWTETARVEESGSCWYSLTFDASFFDDNKKVFQWDDSGAVEYLEKAEVKLQQGISSAYADYLNDSNQFSAAIDWDARWLCALPDCAEDCDSRDEKRKNPKGDLTRREPSGTDSAVILGLPEPQDETGCSNTPSLHLPLNFLPLPTGWDEGEDIPDARLQNSAMQPLIATNIEETQAEPASQRWWHVVTNSNEAPAAESGWPEYPTSYQHIVPSGWDDVHVDQPVTPSRLGADDQESRSDIHTRPADMRWCDYAYSGHPAWGTSHTLTESIPNYGKSHFGKQQCLYSKSQKYGYWRPKRGSDSNSQDPNARRSMQRPGRSISTIHKANHDPRSPRMNRSERSKVHWSSADTPTHGSPTRENESLLRVVDDYRGRSLRSCQPSALKSEEF